MINNNVFKIYVLKFNIYQYSIFDGFCDITRVALFLNVKKVHIFCLFSLVRTHQTRMDQNGLKFFSIHILNSEYFFWI